MTRFIHDQFAKDYLEELLTPLGKVESSKRVPGEVREIDVWFVPANPTTVAANLGLLGKLATTACIFEPFRNPVTANEILDCLLKLLEMRGQKVREANRDKTTLTEDSIPKLWILTPTVSPEILSGFNVNLDEADWGNGIYFLGKSLRTAVIVIHKLPKTPETLWLRILGRGSVQKTAIDELIALPEDNPYRENALKLLYSLQKELEGNQQLDTEERELIMRLSPLYLQDREKAIQEGIEQGIERGIERGIEQGIERGIEQGIERGQRQMIANLLTYRFGTLDEELSGIIDRLVALPPEELASLLLELSQLSPLELIERFGSR